MAKTNTPRVTIESGVGANQGGKPGTVSVIPENHTGITDTVPGFVPDDRRTGVRAGRGSGQGDPRGTLSRAAARDSVRAEGPVRHQGDSDDVRRGALPDAGAGQGRDGGGKCSENRGE